MNRITKTFVLVLFTLLALAGCKDKEEVKPANLGTRQIYTNKASSQFDQIEVRLDGELVGTLTQRYTGSLGASEPLCGGSYPGAVLELKRPAGTYYLEAVAFKDGESIGKWNGNITFEANQCKKQKLNSSN